MKHVRGLPGLSQLVVDKLGDQTLNMLNSHMSIIQSSKSPGPSPLALPSPMASPSKALPVPMQLVSFTGHMADVAPMTPGTADVAPTSPETAEKSSDLESILACESSESEKDMSEVEKMLRKLKS